MRCVAGYRENANRLASIGILETWYLHAYPERANPLAKMDPKSVAVFQKAVSRARQQTNATLLVKSADRKVDGGRRLREDPQNLRELIQHPKRK